MASWTRGGPRLALDLRVEATGHGSLVHQLGENWPSFVAYLVSFLVIGVIWVNHHALFSLVDRVDRPLLFENLVLLMFVVTVPFTTPTLADFIPAGGGNARWAVLLYGISTMGMAVAFTSMLSRMVHHGLLVNPVEPDVGNRAIRRFGLGTVAYPIATAIGLIWPPLVLVAMGGLAAYYMAEQTQILPSTV